MLHNAGSEPWTVCAGDRIAQGKLDTYEVMDDDEATGERTGGFGSTNATYASSSYSSDIAHRYKKTLENLGINPNGQMKKR